MSEKIISALSVVETHPRTADQCARPLTFMDPRINRIGDSAVVPDCRPFARQHVNSATYNGPIEVLA
ncbi:hypothetical protein ACJMK2_024971, partial [Sinanodonta woodiana]